MKKIIGLFAVLALFTLFTLPVHADGAITVDEQRILSELDQGVTVGGKAFHLSPADRTQAENYLKQNDLTVAEVAAVVSNIQSARQLAAAQNINVANIHGLSDLIKAFPREVIEQLRGYVTSVGNLLGLAITFAPGQITVTAAASNQSKNGSESSATNNSKNHLGTGSAAQGGQNIVFSSGNPIKQTGANYTTSIVVFGALLAFAAGAFAVGRKNKLA